MLCECTIILVSLLFGSPAKHQYQPVLLNAKFTDSKYGYHFRHPDSWKAKLYRSGIVVSEVNAPNGEAGVQFRVARLGGSPKTYSENYVSQVEKDLQATLQTSQRGMMQGTEYREYTFHSKRGPNGTFLYQLLLFFPDVKRVIIVQAGCDWNQRESFQEILNEIAKSLEVFDQPALTN